MLTAKRREVPVVGEVSSYKARELLGSEQFKTGSGWAKVVVNNHGYEVYICWGCHRETPERMTWRIREVRS